MDIKSQQQQKQKLLKSGDKQKIRLEEYNKQKDLMAKSPFVWFICSLTLFLTHIYPMIDNSGGIPKKLVMFFGFGVMTYLSIGTMIVIIRERYFTGKKLILLCLTSAAATVLSATGFVTILLSFLP